MSRAEPPPGNALPSQPSGAQQATGARVTHNVRRLLSGSASRVTG